MPRNLYCLQRIASAWHCHRIRRIREQNAPACPWAKQHLVRLLAAQQENIDKLLSYSAGRPTRRSLVCYLRPLCGFVYVESSQYVSWLLSQQHPAATMAQMRGSSCATLLYEKSSKSSVAEQLRFHGPTRA